MLPVSSADSFGSNPGLLVSRGHRYNHQHPTPHGFSRWTQQPRRSMQKNSYTRVVWNEFGGCWCLCVRILRVWFGVHGVMSGCRRRCSEGLLLLRMAVGSAGVMAVSRSIARRGMCRRSVGSWGRVMVVVWSSRIGWSFFRLGVGSCHGRVVNVTAGSVTGCEPVWCAQRCNWVPACTLSWAPPILPDMRSCRCVFYLGGDGASTATPQSRGLFHQQSYLTRPQFGRRRFSMCHFPWRARTCLRRPRHLPLLWIDLRQSQCHFPRSCSS